MKIVITRSVEAGKTLYQVRANGIVLASSFDEQIINERAYYIKQGADAMLKAVTLTSVTLVEEV